jgi:hypothetical protein
MRRVLYTAVPLLVFASASAWADTFTGVTSLAALHSTDSVNWAQFGPTSTLLTTPENWTSVGGATGEVGISGSTIGTQNFERRDQNNGWSGNFTPGDALLYNEGSQGQTNIDFGIVFNTLSNGGGLQIQSDFFGPFTATVTAYGVGGLSNPLFSFSEAGNSTANADGSAIFIGITDTDSQIFFLTFNVVDSVGGGDSMAIDTLYLANSAVPEPTSVLLLSSVLAGCGFLVRRRKA